MQAAPLLTSQVANILGVSSETVRQLENRGQLKASKTASGVRLFDPGEVQRVKRSREERAPVEVLS